MNKLNAATRLRASVDNNGKPKMSDEEKATKQREIAEQTKKIADSKLAYETADEDSKDARKQVLDQDQRQMENIRSK